MKKEGFIHSKIESVEVIELIKIVSVIGKGTEDNPNRYLIQYWSLEGELLADRDTIHDQVDSHSLKNF